MSLGKRTRGLIRRTTSMTGITVDLGDVETPEPSDPQNPMIVMNHHLRNDFKGLGGSEVGELRMAEAEKSGCERRMVAAVLSPRYPPSRSPSGDAYSETAPFLRTCGLCKSRLAPSRDIYMYRGDTAFCSLECREQQMKHDERKEKYAALASKKAETHHQSETAASGTSGKSETVAAA